MIVTALLGPRPPFWFFAQSDGCTRAPDSFRGDDFHRACVYHDWHYSEFCNISRFMADCYLLINLYHLGAPVRLAIAYFLAVRLFGRRHYHKYNPDAKPNYAKRNA